MSIRSLVAFRSAKGRSFAERKATIAVTVWFLSAAAVVHGEEPPPSVARIVEQIARPDVIAYNVGVTARRHSVQAVVPLEEFDYGSAKTRVLLVGHSPEAAESIGRAVIWFYKSEEARSYRSEFSLAAVPQLTPDLLRAAPAVFPPQGEAYTDSRSPEVQYLWRWIGIEAPDLVVDVRPGKERAWFIPPAEGLPSSALAAYLKPPSLREVGELAAALNASAPCETGRVPAMRVNLGLESSDFLETLLAALRLTEFRGPSPARRELQWRVGRSPRVVARQLSEHYGHALPQVVYIPAMALVGRLRLGELTEDPSHLADVQRIVAPYFDGRQEAKPDNGSALSGHLIFSELAERAQGESRERYLALTRNAADLAFDEAGQLRESMPYHTEMSDALFMGGPILAHVGKLTEDPRYFDACLRHLRFMRKLVLREDGLYRHSPLDEAAWGRGNGFPALGLALCLTQWPLEREDRAELLAMFRDHLAALKPFQDPSGCWRQVIDRPDSYRELSCTSMIAFAAARGVQEGWLNREEYDPMIRQAWYAILARTPANGRLVDVCTGTGKQKTLDDYYRRPAILGPDDRGGAMALLAATEMAAYLDDQPR